MKWTLNILLVTLLASCGETQQDCTCEGGPTCLETNIMETPPSDLTSLHAAAGTPKVLVHEVFKIYAELGHNTSNDAEVEEDRNEMYEELTNWLGGKDAGSEGNLSTGIKFSDDLNNGIDVKVTIKVISGELLQRTPIASDGKNRYNSLLNYEIEVIDKDSEKAIRKEASCPDLMVKTCTYYRY